MSAGRVVVIGVGNPFRGDDGAGIEVARRLRGRLPAAVEVVEEDGDPAALLDAWDGARLAFVVDAVRAEGRAGALHRVELDRIDEVGVPGSPRRDSSHGLGLGEAVELARVLDRLPERLVLLGIEGARFDAGDALSDAVRTAVDATVRSLAEEVAAACA